MEIAPGKPSPHVPVPPRSQVYFEYLGNTALTVVGPGSGRNYRFEGRGARREVDLRDRRALTAIAQLKEVR
jgi:hypothetical protein